MAETNDVSRRAEAVARDLVCFPSSSPAQDVGFHRACWDRMGIDCPCLAGVMQILEPEFSSPYLDFHLNLEPKYSDAEIPELSSFCQWWIWWSWEEYYKTLWYERARPHVVRNVRRDQGRKVRQWRRKEGKNDEGARPSDQELHQIEVTGVNRGSELSLFAYHNLRLRLCFCCCWQRWWLTVLCMCFRSRKDPAEGVLLGMGNPLLDVSAVVDKAFLDK